MNPKIVVVGCGVVGALAAYELSAQLTADITVLEAHQPAQGSTGAALGVLMGIISHKVKGGTWRLREASIRRYTALIQELAAQGYPIPFNSQGIVSLCFDASKLPKWETLREQRKAQGWPLEIWTPEELKERCPHINLNNSPFNNHPDTHPPVQAAIYSPADGQVHPEKLTHALINAAKTRGVKFHWDTPVTQLDMQGPRCVGMQTPKNNFAADWVILTAGLGSSALTQVTNEPLELMPVLGQAMELHLPKTLGNEDFQPVINGDDIHSVPLGQGRYWVGATVEFPSETEALIARTEGIADLRRGVERFCPALSQAKILKTWSGLRPRPVGQPAPVIKLLGGTNNVTLATGHYRNGVLLAPATAQELCDLLREKSPFKL